MRSELFAFIACVQPASNPQGSSWMYSQHEGLTGALLLIPRVEVWLIVQRGISPSPLADESYVIRPYCHLIIFPSFYYNPPLSYVFGTFSCFVLYLFVNSIKIHVLGRRLKHGPRKNASELNHRADACNIFHLWKQPWQRCVLDECYSILWNVYGWEGNTLFD